MIVILSLLGLFFKVYSKWANTPTSQKPSPLSKTLNQNPPLKTLKERVILYMSLTGNPTHLGHMGAVASAIDALYKKGMEIDHVRISLSDQQYHLNKVAHSSKKKIALMQEEREYLLNRAIKEAACRNMFQGVMVKYWNDQDKGFSDHPDSYARMINEQHLPVYLVAGEDLCKAMSNWPRIKNAIVVSRNLSYFSNSPPVFDPRQQRIFIQSIYPEFANFSSSSIQKGKIQLEPLELHNYFEQRKVAST